MRLTQLKGISEKREKDLSKLDIFTVEDLVRYFPRDYLDLTQTVNLSECYHNDVVLLACRVTSPPQTVYGRRPFVKVWCEQGGDRFSAVWFNAPYVRNNLKVGEEYLFYGRLQNKYGMGAPSMINPSFELRSRGTRLQGIVPVLVDPAGESIPLLAPDVVVDAILAKRNLGTAMDMAPVVIGVGPGFTVGTDCHAAVETMRGHYLGRALYEGSPLENTAVPGLIGGYAGERVLRAPADGIFRQVYAGEDHRLVGRGDGGCVQDVVAGGKCPRAQEHRRTEVCCQFHRSVIG